MTHHNEVLADLNRKFMALSTFCPFCSDKVKYNVSDFLKNVIKSINWPKMSLKQQQYKSNKLHEPLYIKLIDLQTNLIM